MKKVKTLTLGLLLAISFMACKKNDLPSNEGLDAAKTNSIKKGEPVTFTFSQASGSTVNWLVNPSANTQINTSGNQASIMFGAKGNYTVTAVAGNFSTSQTVSVLDSSDTGGGNGGTPSTILPFSSGETIKINAFKVDSSSLGSGLIFSASTTNKYTCISNRLLSTFTSGTNSFGINYRGVSVPGNCTTGTGKASGFSSLYPISEGTHTLTINLNGITYSGTIVKTDNNYVINWVYTTGVTITPTTL